MRFSLLFELFTIREIVIINLFTPANRNIVIIYLSSWLELLSYLPSLHQIQI